MAPQNASRFEMSPKKVSAFHIACDVLSWASLVGGEATNSLSHVHKTGVSYSRYRADRMLNSTQSINPIPLIRPDTWMATNSTTSP